jgi:hypothetical protein
MVWEAMCRRALSCEIVTTSDNKSLAFSRSSWFPLVPKHVNIRDTVCCCACLLIVLQNWSICIQEKCPQHSSRQSLSFELLYYGRCWVFPFETVMFALWIVMVDLRLVLSDNMTEKRHLRCINGSIGLGRLSRFHMCSPVNCFAHILWSPVRSWDDSMSRTITDAQIIRPFVDIHSRLSRIIAWKPSLFPSVVNMGWRHDHPSSVIFVRPFFNMVIPSNALHCSKALFLCCAESLRRVSAPGKYSSPKNRIAARCSSWVHTERGSATLTQQRLH